MKVVIAYDVRDDDARARLAALLATYGVRIQRSVFECLFDEETLAEVLERADRLIDLRHDSVHAFPVCADCSAARHALGQDRSDIDEPYWVVV